MKVIIHDDLKKRISMAAENGSSVALFILKMLKEGREARANMNYFDSIRVSSHYELYNAIRVKLTCCNKDVTNDNFPEKGKPNVQWEKKYRCEVKAPDIVAAFADCDTKMFTDEEYAFFMSAICCSTKITLKVMSSLADIEKSYNRDNYAQVVENGGKESHTLYNSCMSYPERAADCGDFYANFAKAKILCAIGDDGCVYGRSLLWNNIEIADSNRHIFSNKKYSLLDRVYVSYDFILKMFYQWAQKSVDFRKYINDSSNKNTFIAQHEMVDMAIKKGDNVTLNVIVRVPQLKWHKAGAPYVDTLTYLYYNTLGEGDRVLFLSNNRNFNGQLAEMLRTSGEAIRVNRICPVCGKVHSSSYQEICPKCESELFKYSYALGQNVYVGKKIVQYENEYYPYECMKKGKPNKFISLKKNVERIYKSA